MSLGYRLRPGGGFVLLGVVAACAAAFFAWGFSTPRLDAVWRLQTELKIGERPPLTTDERRLFEDALAEFPEIAEGILDGAPHGAITPVERGLVFGGYVYLLRVRPSPALELRVRPVAGAPLQVSATTGQQTRSGTATRSEPYTFVVPDDGAFPQLLELRADGGREGWLIEVVERP